MKVFWPRVAQKYNPKVGNGLAIVAGRPRDMSL